MEAINLRFYSMEEEITLLRAMFLERSIMQYSKKPLPMTSLFTCLKKTTLNSLFMLFYINTRFNTFMALSSEILSRVKLRRKGRILPKTLLFTA